MSQETILKTTLNIFAHFGMKGVSMNQVAEALGISKKTLYAYFGNKDKLLAACLDYEKKIIIRMMDDLEKKHRNPVAAIASLTYHVSQYKSSYSHSFYKDIPHFYLGNNMLESIREAIKQKFIYFLKQGAEEGYFFVNGNYEMIATVFMEQIILIGRQTTLSSPSHKLIVLITFLRGLSTDKGLALIERLLPKEEEKNIYEELYF